jgi:cell division protein FtsB
MGTRRARTTRTLPAPSERPVAGAAVPIARMSPPRARRQSGATAPEPRSAAPRSVLGLRLPQLQAARRPRWPRVLVALIALYAGFLVATDAVRLIALNRQIAAVNAQIARVDAHDLVLKMQAAALQDPSAIADTARKWLGLAAPGDVVFTPVPPAH